MEKKKWWQSKTIALAVTLILAAGNQLLQQIGFITNEQVKAAQEAYPQLANGIEQVQHGMWYSGLATVIGVLVVYFRFKTKTVIQ